MKTPANLALLIAILFAVGQTAVLAKDKDDTDKPAKESEAAVNLAKHPGVEAGKVRKEEKKEAIKEKKSGQKESRTQRVNERTEERQKHQARRIQEGIKKGYLTPTEITKMETQQKSIESLQQAMNADGKVTKDEAKQLHQ
ncbi:MAG: hypothetical protein NTY53_22885, partial [Kiritimatiellaeota bacterium]|nr:hypothetical protein [Kiritimatiellota bacterium]